MNINTVKPECVECGSVYASSANLYRHIRQKHEGGVSFSCDAKLKCLLCDNVFISKRLLEEHIFFVHEIRIEKENITFPSMEDFDTWKAKIEKENMCMYAKRTGSRELHNGKTSYFYCHRSGYFNGRGMGKRNIKTMGTNKINDTCPAMIKVVETNLLVNVEYTKTHTGHTSDIGRMKLTAEEKNAIANKLANKVPITAVLDEIRDNFSDDLERVHLLSRRDLLNIKAEYNMQLDGVLHSSDAVSVNKWVLNMQKSGNSPVTFYKPQNVIDQILYPGLNKDDFLLVIMNESQKEMLNLYGSDVICLDFTHGMNAYNFDLATVLVLDDKREGFPAAFILSNRQDFTALNVAFESLKKQGAAVSPKILMSDDAESFYNAWKVVFGKPEKRLLCSWHVDRSWRKKLRELVPNKGEQAEVYKILRCLLSETDEEAFSILIKESIIFFGERSTLQDFGIYFQKIYVNRAEMWAYCFRKWAGVNTNMHIERMHRTVKYIYLEGKKVKRLDRALMKFIRDKLFDRLITLQKGKISSKISQLRNRHKASKQMSRDVVSNSEDEWTVCSQTKTGELHTVRQINLCSKDCTLLCKDCGYCLHNFTCTCIDNSIQWNMCKHIHLVCGKMNILSISSTGMDHDSENENLFIHESRTAVVKNQELDIHVKNLKKSQQQLGATTEQQKTKLWKIHCDIGKAIEKCSTLSDYQAISKILKEALTSVETYKKRKLCNLPKPFNCINNEPCNKKIKPQRFISTKKRHTVKKSNQLLKPTPEESNNIACSLIIQSKSRKDIHSNLLHHMDSDAETSK